MHRLTNVADIGATPDVAVVINVHTDLVATLAIASAVRHAAMPVVLVNCDPSAQSSAHFDRLAARLDFTIVDAPARRHADTLNRLFAELRADVVLLLDSDAEIRDPTAIARMRRAFDNPWVFGAGYVHGPMWLDAGSGNAPGTSLYQERAWMPCVLLRSQHVREAFDAGVTFSRRTIYNDVMWSRRLSKLMAARFQTRGQPDLAVVRRLPTSVRSRLSQASLPRLAWARGTFYGLRPNYVVCDTGADLYQWCKYRRGMLFAGASYDLGGSAEVAHYGGVTRNERGRTLSHSVDTASVQDDVVERLRRDHGIDWSDEGPEP